MATPIIGGNKGHCARMASEKQRIEGSLLRAMSSLRLLGFLTICLLPSLSEGSERRPAREEGTFRIYLAGQEIGTERYVILASSEAASSSSVIDFRNPVDNRQNVHLETKQEMGRNFVPRSYQLSSDVSGKKEAVVAYFSPHQAMFEYSGSGTPYKRGVLVGDTYTLLDTNVFHHFIFLARLFKFDGAAKIQRFEVVIPQEADSGALAIMELGRESVPIQSKPIQAHHLQIDSGSLVVHLWVDDRRVLQKIAVPSKAVEVVRTRR